jgi:hypothetical protein
MKDHAVLRSIIVGLIVAVPCAVSLAQPTCGVRATAQARGSIGTPGATQYDDTPDSGWLSSPLFAPMTVDATGSRASAGCSAASTVHVGVQHGYATITGTGAATNCFTGSAVMYANAPDGARASDRLNISSTAIPAGTRVPIRLRIDLRGGCTSSQAPFPFCDVRARILSSGTFGTFNLYALSPGVFEGTTDVGTVGSFLDIQAILSAYAGAGSDSLQLPNQPAFTATCSINVGARFTAECLEPLATITACSGHNYSVGLCPADLDNGSGNGTPDGGVDINDLLYFLVQFEAGSIAADLDNGLGGGTPDGGVDINDLLYFLIRFENGC